jgi:drug/metabolite transporter (DMT)-like permease
VTLLMPTLSESVANPVSGRIALPVLAAMAIGVQVGLSIVLTRAVANDVGAISLTFLRYFVAALCLVPIVLVTTGMRVRMRDILPIAFLGMVQFGLLILLLNFGLRSVPAGPGGILFATSPVFALILGVWTGRERWSGRKAVGIVLALAGPALATDVRGDVASMSAGVGSAVVLLGAGSGIGYMLWLWALKSIDASTVTAFLMLGPVTALLAGAVFLDEVVTLGTVLGMVVLGAGLWITTGLRRKA